MPEKRTKVVTTSIEDGRATFNCYSDPALGDQEVTNTLVYDVRNFDTPTLADLAAFGFTAVASNRYQHGGTGHPDVPAITQALYEEMIKGTWKPGKRDTGASEPTDLMRAVAEATNTPVHLVAHKFQTDMLTVNHKPSSQDPDSELFRDRAGKSRRFFNPSTQRQIAADPAVAPILARLEQERAKATLASLKSNKQPSKLSTLFSMDDLAAQ